LTFGPPAPAEITYSNGNENTHTPLEAHEGLAVIRVSGLLLKTVPVWSRQRGLAATSYVWLRDQLEQTIEDRGVREISLRINSPGGSVAGVAPAVEVLYALRCRKPVAAVIEDTCTGAAFWLASQASRIVAVDRNAIVGGIGCFVSFPDFSEQFKKQEIVTHVIASGGEKGMGVLGAPITEEQRAGWQGLVDADTDNFVAAVARGRRLTIRQVKPMADGKTWNAATAQALGLIDDIQL
jgi:protease-4